MNKRCSVIMPGVSVMVLTASKLIAPILKVHRNAALVRSSDQMHHLPNCVSKQVGFHWNYVKLSKLAI